jgi:DNA-binding transcriptional regulator/RsmH inhibitor MraZ
VIGVSNRAEIWDKDRWENQAGTLTADSIAEAMNELGF